MPWRRLSPSSSMVWRPCSTSLRSTRSAMVDLPAPGRPVSHSTSGRWPFIAARRAGVTWPRCGWTLVAAARFSTAMPGRRGLQRRAIDQDEAAGRAVLGVGIEGHRHRRLDPHPADRVERQLVAGRARCSASSSSRSTMPRHRGRHGRGADLEQEGLARLQRAPRASARGRPRTGASRSAVAADRPAGRRGRCRSRRRA